MTECDSLQLHMLMFIIAVPIAGLLCIALIDQKKFPNNIKLVAIWTSLFSFILSTLLCVFTDKNTNIHISFLNYSFSVNEISLCMIEITSFTTLITHIFAAGSISTFDNNDDTDTLCNATKQLGSKFYIFTLMLEAIFIALFSSADILAFFFLLELITRVMDYEY